MILPIVPYGNPILRKVAQDINSDFPQLDKLIENMWETMYNSNGVGLAAPQINQSIRLFIVDSAQIVDDAEEEDVEKYKGHKGIKQVFINAELIETNGKDWPYEEGCLSIPKIRADVKRAEQVTIAYFDEKFQPHEESFDNITARIILHEYDHLEGKLFIDYLTPLKRKLLKSKLDDITKGRVNIGYKMLYK